MNTLARRGTCPLGASARLSNLRGPTALVVKRLNQPSVNFWTFEPRTVRQRIEKVDSLIPQLKSGQFSWLFYFAMSESIFKLWGFLEAWDTTLLTSLAILMSPRPICPRARLSR